ncbi:hypothetical protein D3C78_1948270 [compost metagenome]
MAYIERMARLSDVHSPRQLHQGVLPAEGFLQEALEVRRFRLEDRVSAVSREPQQGLGVLAEVHQAVP